MGRSGVKSRYEEGSLRSVPRPQELRELQERGTSVGMTGLGEWEISEEVNGADNGVN